MGLPSTAHPESAQSKCPVALSPPTGGPSRFAQFGSVVALALPLLPPFVPSPPWPRLQVVGVVVAGPGDVPPPPGRPIVLSPLRSRPTFSRRGLPPLQCLPVGLG